MPMNRVRAGVFVVVVIEALAPVGWDLPLEQWHEAAALHLLWHRYARSFEKSWRQVEVADDVAVLAPTLLHPRPAHQKRRAERLLEDPPLVEPPVFAEVEPLIGGINHERVF